MNYYIRMEDNSIRAVDKANPFIYEEIRLFTWWRESIEEFQVVESTTGLLLSSCTTEEEAVKTAKESLNRVGIEKIKQRITEKQKEFNINTLKSIMNTEVI